MEGSTSTMKPNSVIIMLFLLICTTGARADDFFSINRIDCDRKSNHPSLNVDVSVKDEINSSALRSNAYFYDSGQKLIATMAAPIRSYSWPVIFPKDQQVNIPFRVPDDVLKQSDWSAVVTFGDIKEVEAKVYIGQTAFELIDYDFPEKNIVEDKTGPDLVHTLEMDPLIEHVVQTRNPSQPQITLFLRSPLEMKDATQAKGVLCLSLLANDLGGVRRKLQGFQEGDDVRGILKFADEHKLIIICWGSRSLWNPEENWDDLSPAEAKKEDAGFDQVADAWEKGVQYFVDEYKIPKDGYLLSGQSGAAQYACRLALRKPAYFLAVHVHIPSSFDKPTPEGNKVLWCLTTGELEAGHARSLRFYAQCQELGYPIIYKAIVGLGHLSSHIADDLEAKFFEYALSVRDQREAYEEASTNPLDQFQMSQASGQAQPWLESFRKPMYVGDIVNQEMFPSDQGDMVPVGFRTPLPTKDIADAWNQ
jgi:hypothetical protein